MSKLDEEVRKRFTIRRSDDVEKGIDMQRASDFYDGYHQAEKDLELTWKDMMIIHKCIKDAVNHHLDKMMEGMEGQKIVYEEVLKQFKKKGEKGMIDRISLVIIAVVIVAAPFIVYI